MSRTNGSDAGRLSSLCFDGKLVRLCCFLSIAATIDGSRIRITGIEINMPKPIDIATGHSAAALFEALKISCVNLNLIFLKRGSSQRLKESKTRRQEHVEKESRTETIGGLDQSCFSGIAGCKDLLPMLGEINEHETHGELSEALLRLN